MAASPEKVVNLALRHLGEEPTETIDPTQARSAVRKVLGFLYDAVDVVLIAHDWLDARGYVTVQPSGAGGNFRWPSLYWMPEGALMVRDVESAAPGFCQASWERGTELDAASGAWRTVIRATGDGPLNVTFTRRIGWEVIPVYLEQAMGLQLAAMACQPVNGSVDLADRLEKRTALAVGLAQGKDGVQARSLRPEFPDVYGGLRRSAL